MPASRAQFAPSSDDPGETRAGRQLLGARVPLYVIPSSFLMLGGFLWGMLWLILWQLGRAVDLGTPSGWLALQSAGLYLLLILLHEAGHGVVGVMFGARIEWVRISARSGVILDRTPVRWARVLVSAAGPGMELMVGASMVALSHSLSSPFSVAGALGMVNGTVGLLVPIRATSDGRKLWRGVGQVLGRVPTATVGRSEA